MGIRISRRTFIAASGALVVSFPLSGRLFAADQQPMKPGEDAKKAPKLPGSLKNTPLLDSWIRIDADGGITVFTGKVELGQGIKTALIQVAAEELVVEPGSIKLITADTSSTPDERYTAGSQSMQDSATAIRNAAAQVRAILIELAAQELGAPTAQLTVENGAIRSAEGRSVSYGKLVAKDTLHVEAQPRSPLRDPSTHRVIGKSLPRVDIPVKLTGAPIYVQDLRLPRMVHARVVRPPNYRARLRSLNAAAMEKMPGVLKIVRNGSFLAVVAEREYQAIAAMRELAKAAVWEAHPTLLDPKRLYESFQQLTAQERIIRDGKPVRQDADAIEATYRRPYQMHASIGPSCAVGLYQNEQLTVWTHSQGVYPLRGAIAELVGLPPERVRCVHMEGSGCYGHNAADDAGGDAALIALAFPGRPVRVQWMRPDEHAWEPYGSAMIGKARARLAGDRIADWQYEVWSCPHSTRPGPAGNLSAAWLLEKPFEQPIPKPIPQPTGGGDRNAIPLYTIPNVRVVHQFVTDMPLRVSALRALGGYLNVFALESFMDELARAARSDPVDFRLRHLDDPRARDAVRTAAERFGWAAYNKRAGRGRGFGFARYKNLAAYAALACEVEVDRETGRVRVIRAVAAVDSGEAVNPNGIRNQMEGAIVQSISWTLYESVSFDTRRILSTDWSTYPILRFANVPERIDVHVLNRPGQPFLGTGEAGQGPTAAAVANAIADATGVRFRDLPLTPARLRRALGAA
ncbi:MAG TPA: molybdopterin cofactor-binding domain-containing protein [Burkholderiales bacterium]|nr:molybdopterin cofactor-binding domain-containing protein [Burkholderiales bacterium]